MKNLCNSCQGYSARSHTRKFLILWVQIQWRYVSHNFRNNQETLKSWYTQLVQTLVNNSFPFNSAARDRGPTPVHTPKLLSLRLQWWNQSTQHWSLVSVPSTSTGPTPGDNRSGVIYTHGHETHIPEQLHRNSTQWLLSVQSSYGCSRNNFI